MDTMNFITLTLPEAVHFATLNALLVLPHPLNAVPAIPKRTELLELVAMEFKPASAIQDITQLLTDHASSPTAMLILSALNALKVLTSAFNVLPL
jgi:hypothetical protein